MLKVPVYTEQKQRTKPFWACDFLNQTSGQQAPFTSVLIASGTLNAPNTLTSQHPGVIRFRSSTTTNSGALIGTNSAQLILGGGEEFNAIFQLDTLALSTYRLGFHDSVDSTDAVDGCYLEIASTGVATGKTASNSTRSSTGTTTTLVTATWYRLRIVLNPAASRVDFYIYNDAGTLVWSDNLTTNIPPATVARVTAAVVNATNSGTTALDLMHLDYMSIKFGALVRGGA